MVMQKEEKGAVTIEATISLSAFMFTIVTVLTILNICMIQARIAVAINTSAKELSQYSYLYSLTGFQTSESELAAATEGVKGDIDGIVGDINTVFTEIENLKNGAGNKAVAADPKGLLQQWEDAVGSAENIKNAGVSLNDTLEGLAEDPKGLLFGMAKLAASDGLELAKSRLIAAPLAKALCKKHLLSSKESGDNAAAKKSKTEAFLKGLGVVPSANGSYMDGLDFSKSSIFPYGSNEIRIRVSYDVKVIALLPIDFTFHFSQTAVTHGWMSGETSVKDSQDYVATNTLWTQASVQERAALIRHMVIDDLEDEGYEKASGLTDVQMYDPDKNEFVMITSMNPLWSGEGEETKRVEDLDTEAIKKQLEQLCGKMDSTTDGLTTIETKTTTEDGTVTRKENNCTNANNKIVLVIPEDNGLKEKMEAILAEANTRGITIELQTGYGNGANRTAAET